MLNRSLYPYAAMVGQEKAKKALLMAAVNPKAGGLLIGGATGCGKSTLVRSIKELVTCNFIDLPLNATEDMVFGSLDLEAAVSSGRRQFMPGILARANDSLLYIDDANLLRTELLTAILDAAVSKLNIVERDGISYTHKVDTTILATMNPLEGSLNSQLLDRFGMYVEMDSLKESAARVQIMAHLLSYDKDRLKFRSYYASETARLKKQIAAAKAMLPQVEISEAMMQLSAKMCSDALCAGHRADVYLLEAARSIAALENRSYVLPKDVEEAAQYVLVHRVRQLPQQSPEDGDNTDDNNEQQDSPEDDTQQPQDDGDNDDGSQDEKGENEDGNQPPPLGSQGDYNQEHGPEPEDKNEPENDNNQQQEPDNNLGEEDKVAGIDTTFTMPRLIFDLGQDRKVRRGSGKRSLTKTDLKQGRYVRAGYPKEAVTDLAFDATIRAAAPYQKIRPFNGCALNISKSDLRQKVREKRIGTTFLFAVDASGSMGARERMKAVKGAIFALLQEAYQKRDKVGMVAFRRKSAEVLLPITRSIDLAQKCLQELPTGGKTPLADGLATSLLCLYNRQKQEPDVEPIFVLITDGRANVVEQGKDPVAEAVAMAERIGKAGVTSIVIDTETDFIKLGIAKKVATAMEARYFSLKQLSEESLIRIVRQVVK